MRAAWGSEDRKLKLSLKKFRDIACIIDQNNLSLDVGGLVRVVRGVLTAFGSFLSFLANFRDFSPLPRVVGAVGLDEEVNYGGEA